MFLCRVGNSNRARQFTADHSNRMQVGKPIGIFSRVSATEDHEIIRVIHHSGLVTECPERRALLSFMRYGVFTQPAAFVRGNSRRITIVRFRPADIRVIHCRIRLPSRLLRCCSQPLTVFTTTELDVGFDKVASYQKMSRNANCTWREALALEILPKPGVPTSASGLSNAGVLLRLKDSARS